jgi:arginine decarboxylase
MSAWLNWAATPNSRKQSKCTDSCEPVARRSSGGDRAAGPGGNTVEIQIVSAVGRARTLLSSFDAALKSCGVHNYNLIPLSSVIPPQSSLMQVDQYRRPVQTDQHGHRLYVVKADARSDQPGQAVGAAIGWYRWDDDRGVFVEHEVVGVSQSGVEAELRCRVVESLADLCAFRGVPFAPNRAGMRLTSAETDGTPTTALALAVYRAEPWQ